MHDLKICTKKKNKNKINSRSFVFLCWAPDVASPLLLSRNCCAECVSISVVENTQNPTHHHNKNHNQNQNNNNHNNNNDDDDDDDDDHNNNNNNTSSSSSSSNNNNNNSFNGRVSLMLQPASVHCLFAATPLWQRPSIVRHHGLPSQQLWLCHLRPMLWNLTGKMS